VYQPADRSSRRRPRALKAAATSSLVAGSLLVAGCGTCHLYAAAGAPAAPALPPNLTASQLVGQRVIYSYTGLTPPAGLLTKIRLGEAAGVIFFSGNVSSMAQIRRVIKELQQANSHSPVRVPLLMLTDQEGGLVSRLPGAPVLSEKQIGQSSQGLRLAREAGTGAGRNLDGVGMNVNLAPVLDVYRTAGDFIDQFERSYSSNPATVSRLGSAFIKAQQQFGVAATAKHFPGLGSAATAQNTDLRPVTLRLSASTIRNVDELPYRSAIAARVKLVMVSWAIYPALDPVLPAGLSTKIVQGELRQRLGFAGVTITDALEADALGPFGSIANRAILAARAGMDLLLCASGNVSEGESAMNSLASSYLHGSLNSAALKAADKRILALRATLPG
jgi:beta-N-acetylhexosaminidase